MHAAKRAPDVGLVYDVIKPNTRCREAAYVRAIEIENDLTKLEQQMLVVSFRLDIFIFCDRSNTDSLVIDRR